MPKMPQKEQKNKHVAPPSPSLLSCCPYCSPIRHHRRAAAVLPGKCNTDTDQWWWRQLPQQQWWWQQRQQQRWWRQWPRWQRRQQRRRQWRWLCWPLPCKRRHNDGVEDGGGGGVGVGGGGEGMGKCTMMRLCQSSSLQWCWTMAATAMMHPPPLPPIPPLPLCHHHPLRWSMPSIPSPSCIASMALPRPQANCLWRRGDQQWWLECRPWDSFWKEPQ